VEAEPQIDVRTDADSHPSEHRQPGAVAARAEAREPTLDGAFVSSTLSAFFRQAPDPAHESVETTQTYLHAHLALKEAALAKLKYEGAKRTRFRPNDRLLAFLEAL
jgi:hypothetical protein